MNIYLVDFENVNSQGLNGINRLESGDRIIIFYSENADSMTFELHEQINQSRAYIYFQKVDVGTKNALDFQLATYLGYLICENEKAGIVADYYVVTKDRGYSSLITYWTKRDVDITLVGTLIQSMRIQKERSIERRKAADGQGDRPAGKTRNRNAGMVSANAAAARAEQLGANEEEVWPDVPDEPEMSDIAAQEAEYGESGVSGPDKQENRIGLGEPSGIAGYRVVSQRGGSAAGGEPDSDSASMQSIQKTTMTSDSAAGAKTAAAAGMGYIAGGKPDASGTNGQVGLVVTEDVSGQTRLAVAEDASGMLGQAEPENEFGTSGQAENAESNNEPAMSGQADLAAKNTSAMFGQSQSSVTEFSVNGGSEAFRMNTGMTGPSDAGRAAEPLAWRDAGMHDSGLSELFETAAAGSESSVEYKEKSFAAVEPESGVENREKSFAAVEPGTGVENREKSFAAVEPGTGVENRDKTIAAAEPEFGGLYKEVSAGEPESGGTYGEEAPAAAESGGEFGEEAPAEQPEKRTRSRRRAKAEPEAEADTELRIKVEQAVPDKDVVDLVVSYIKKYKTKLGINNALAKEFKDSKKASEIYKSIKPLIADKKGQ